MVDVPPSWQDIPVIVSENAVKDAVNAKAATAFAKRTGHQLHWYYCTDTRGGKTLTDDLWL